MSVSSRLRSAWLAAVSLLLAVLTGPATNAQRKPAAGRTVLYAAVGAELIQYDVDRETAS